MNEIQEKVDAVIQIFDSKSSLAKKATDALQALSSMDITHATKENKKHLRQFPNKINTILGRYPFIKTYEDYEKVSEDDLNKILQHVQCLCLQLPANLRIAKQLKYNNGVLAALT